MNLLFVSDPLESFQTYKDSTFAMMRELQRRGHQIAACEPRHLAWQAATGVQAHVRRITLTGHEERWFHETPQTPAQRLVALRDFDAVLMRKDPPFDSEYFYATHLLEQAEREGPKSSTSRVPCAITRKNSPSSNSRSSSGRHWSHAMRRPSVTSMPRSATSSSNRSTVWVAWASTA
jgi:hypothetical protein